MIKRCVSCKQEKRARDFSRCAASKDGLHSYCKECAKIKNREYRQKNRDYYLENKEQMDKYRQSYRNKRRKEDIGYKIRTNLRGRLWHAIKSGQKSGSAVRDLGCSIEELTQYLEPQFQPGMSWENYGEWHLDHLTPLSSFDLTDREQLLKACHYTNLQPLWKKDNLAKGDRII